MLCLEVREFQDKWHSFLNALKRELPIGMWTTERQPRSGNWHVVLFGVWGRMRFVHSRFTFLSSRIVQKRKQWLAMELEIGEATELSRVLGKQWWFHFGRALCEVIMPLDFYMVGSEGARRWDDLGLKTLARDCAAWPGAPSEDLANQSRFSLFREIGGHLFGADSRQAIHWAMNRMARPEPAPLIELDPQLILTLKAAIERTKRDSSP